MVSDDLTPLERHGPVPGSIVEFYGQGKDQSDLGPALALITGLEGGSGLRAAFVGAAESEHRSPLRKAFREKKLRLLSQDDETNTDYFDILSWRPVSTQTELKFSSVTWLSARKQIHVASTVSSLKSTPLCRRWLAQLLFLPIFSRWGD